MSTRSPHTPSSSSSIPHQPRRSSFAASSHSLIPSSARRPSTGTSPNPYSLAGSPAISVAASPSLATTGPNAHPTSPSSTSGIPAFRSLRSLLPFGPGKHATPVSPSVSPPAAPNTHPTPSASRSPFAGFGSVRRSMTRERERKTSFSDALPVIAIGPPALGEEDPPVRRSVSLSRLEKPLPSEPPERKEEDTVVLGRGAPVLRTPSPGPPLSAELSTIIEADTSGASRHQLLLVPSPHSHSASHSLSNSHPHPQSQPQTLTNNSNTGHFLFPHTPTHHPGPLPASSPNLSPILPVRPSPAPSPGNSYPNHHPQPRNEDDDGDELDLSTSHVALHVLDAMRGSARNSAQLDEVGALQGVEGSEAATVAREWRAGGGVVDIDADGDFEDDTRAGEGDGGSLLGDLDPDLKQLLSPNSLLPSSTSAKPAPPSSSPSTPSFASASTTTLASTTTTRPGPRTSLLPRLRGTSSGDAESPKFPPFSPPPPAHNSKPSPATQLSPSRTIIIHQGDTPPQSPVTPSGAGFPALANTSTPAMIGTSTPASAAAAGGRLPYPAPPRIFSPVAKSTISAASGGGREDREGGRDREPQTVKRPAARALRQAMLGVTSPGGSSTSLGEPSSPSRLGLRLGLGWGSTPSLGGVGGRSRAGSASPERSVRAGEVDDSILGRPSGEGRPSIDDSVSGRPSMDSSRPSGEWTRERSSLDLPRSHSSGGARIRERVPLLGAERLDRTLVGAERLSPSPAPSGSSRLGASAGVRLRKRSMSVQERLGRMQAPTGRFGDLGLGQRPVSSLSVGRGGGRVGLGERVGGGEASGSGGEGTARRAEWLGPRTAKAFRAAGLLDFEQSRIDTDLHMHRDRSGSVVVSPSPVMARPAFASMRSASEYNPSYSHGGAHPRPAFSDAGAGDGRRRESVSGSASAYGGRTLMESPTFTTSSGSRDRDTPLSSSTAPTSVSGSSFGYFGRDRGERDRDREREEIRELRDKHSTETGALLGALSDSQRTVRVLREENADLRERMERMRDVEAENGELRQVCAELRRECAELRREGMVLRANARAAGGGGYGWRGGGGLTTPLMKQVNGRGAAARLGRVQMEEESPEPLGEEKQFPSFNLGSEGDEEVLEEEDGDPLDPPMGVSSTPAKIRRRYSASSSIFPVPPANMTMLLHEDAAALKGAEDNANRSSADTSFRFPVLSHSRSQSLSQAHSASPSVSFRGLNGSGVGHTPNRSITSTVSISPTTVNFSMATGSPGSLCLRPEHEMLLEEMESLDLSVRGEGDSDGLVVHEDDW